MSFRSFLYLMGTATLAAFGAWGVVLFFIDPASSGGLGFFFFYATLFLALFGSASLIGVALRAHRDPLTPVSRHVMRSSRHAVFLSVLVVGSVFLLSRGLFSLLTAGLFILFLTLLELFFEKVAR